MLSAILRSTIPVCLLALMACSRTTPNAADVSAPQGPPAEINVSPDGAAKANKLLQEPQVRPYDPRSESGEKEKPPPVEPKRHVVALGTPVTQAQIDKAPLPLPTPELPKYPDGNWKFLAVADSFGLPLGIRRVEPGAKLMREHFEIAVEGDRIISLKKLDVQGRLVWMRNYSYQPGQTIPSGFSELNAYGALVAQGSFEDGARLYRYSASSGASLLDGCHFLKRELSPLGFVVSQRCLSREMEPIPSKSGVHEVRFERTDVGLATKRYNMGSDSTPVADVNGVHLQEYDYDLDGALTRITYLGVDKTAIVHETHRCSRIDYSYTSSGLLASEKYFGIHSEPTAGALGVFGIQYLYDDKGYLTQETTVGIGGAPAPPTGAKASKLVRAYDDLGRLLRTESFAPDGQPAPRGTGFHLERIEYPQSSEQIVSCFDVRSRPTACSHGTPMLRRELDAQGRIVLETSLNSDGEPSAPRSDKLRSCYTSRQWDPEGRLRRTLWLTCSRRAVAALGGPTAVANEYNAFGDVTEQSFRMLDGSVGNANWGFALSRTKFDSWGRPVSVCAFDPLGGPALAARPSSPFQGFHCISFSYSNSWNPDEVGFFDAAMNPVAVSWGATGLSSHKASLQWNPMGKLLRIVPALPLPPPIEEAGAAAADQADVRSPDMVAQHSDASADSVASPPLPLEPPPPLDCQVLECPNPTELNKVMLL